MIRNVIFLLSVFAVASCGLNLYGQDSEKSLPAEDSGVLIKISLPGYNWLEIYYSEFEATYASPSTNFSQARCDINYEIINYKKNTVNVAAYIAFVEEDGKVNKDAVTSEQEVNEPTGVLHVFFVKQNLRLEGIAEMNIYLTDKKNDIISNILVIPVAAGEEAVKQIEEQLGPSRTESAE
jgi:hypothetical protein